MWPVLGTFGRSVWFVSWQFRRLRCCWCLPIVCIYNLHSAKSWGTEIPQLLPFFVVSLGGCCFKRVSVRVRRKGHRFTLRHVLSLLLPFIFQFLVSGFPDIRKLGFTFTVWWPFKCGPVVVAVDLSFPLCIKIFLWIWLRKGKTDRLLKFCGPQSEP